MRGGSLLRHLAGCRAEERRELVRAGRSVGDPRAVVRTGTRVILRLLVAGRPAVRGGVAVSGAAAEATAVHEEGEVERATAGR